MKWEEIRERQVKLFEIALKEDVQYHGYNYFQDIFLVKTTPLLPLDTIDLTTTFCGKKLDFPIMISGLAGADKDFVEFNSKLAEFANKYNIGMAIGDQIFSLKNQQQRSGLNVIRKKNPSGLVFGNLGARYIADKTFTIADLQDCIDNINADAMEIYLNSLQDVLWHEEYQGGLQVFIEKLQRFIPQVKVPIFIKSMTTGISNEEVRMYWDLGVAGFDTQGVGGTSFVRMNTMKQVPLQKKQSFEKIENPFDFWGIPTVWSLLDIALRQENKSIPLIAGGGIRNGIDAVKCLALGANMVSLGIPVLIQIMEDFAYPNEKNLITYFENFIREMKITMHLMGVRNLEELQSLGRNRIPIMGPTKQWLEVRNLKYNEVGKEKH